MQFANITTETIIGSCHIYLRKFYTIMIGTAPEKSTLNEVVYQDLLEHLLKQGIFFSEMDAKNFLHQGVIRSFIEDMMNQCPELIRGCLSLKHTQRLRTITYHENEDLEKKSIIYHCENIALEYLSNNRMQLGGFMDNVLAPAAERCV